MYTATADVTADAMATTDATGITGKDMSAMAGITGKEKAAAMAKGTVTAADVMVSMMVRAIADAMAKAMGTADAIAGNDNVADSGIYISSPARLL